MHLRDRTCQPRRRRCITEIDRRVDTLAVRDLLHLLHNLLFTLSRIKHHIRPTLPSQLQRLIPRINAHDA